MKLASPDEMRRQFQAEMAHLGEPLFMMKPSSDLDWLSNVSIGSEDWNAYATGYKQAADILVQHLDKSEFGTALGRFLLAYPAIFLYRHYIELRLKELLIMSSHLLDKPVRLPKEHKILDIWNQVRSHLEYIDRNEAPEESRSSYEAIEARLRELATADPDSISFRYPTDLKGKASIKGTRHLNLRQVKDVMQAISNLLDGASTGLSEGLKMKNEMRQEIEQSYHV